MTAELCWALMPSIRVVDAAALMAGHIPNDPEVKKILKDNGAEKVRIDAMVSLIISAIREGEIKGQLFNSKAQPGDEIDVEKVILANEEFSILERLVVKIYVDTFELKEWVLDTSIPERFFMKYSESIDKQNGKRVSREEQQSKEKLDNVQQTLLPMSNTLQAAIDVFEYLRSNPGKLAKSKPKKEAIEWLKKNYKMYNLVRDKDGKPQETTIERIAAIVNWEKSGGAPKST
ncbi:MAG: hypothetical protein J0L55_02210 [Caulobacterales bacterium]|nr:hypothetical protein [Caulobacterales bacterium]MCA0372184.1 hypothetical protein [Pseudomonadota bacterium]